MYWKMEGGAVIFQNFDINYIKMVLSGDDKKLQKSFFNLLELNHMQCDTDDMIRSLSVKADDFTGTSARLHDVSSLLLRRRQLMEEQKKEIQCEMWRLMEEEETVRRIWACYRGLEGEEFQIVRALYAERQLYSAVERESGMSHGTFEKKRAAAIRKIQSLYHSELDNLAIITKKYKTDHQNSQKKVRAV